MSVSYFSPRIWLPVAAGCLALLQDAPAGAQSTLDLGEALIRSQAPQNVSRHPDYYKPGERAVVQRSLFPISEGAQLIQIAFVIDGTDSMGRDIDGLKANLAKIIEEFRNRSAGKNAVRKPPVEVAIVVYRDLQSPSGAVEIPEGGQRRFNGFQIVTESTLEDFAQSPVHKMLSAVRTEKGYPYFPEQIDRGLHAALTELEWDNSAEVARAIIVAGDAPPWSEAYRDASVNRRIRGLEKIGVPLRGYSTGELSTLAAEKEIRVFSILCNSGFVGEASETLQKTAQQARPELRQFFRTLAEGTGGRFLDLSDQEIVKTLKEDIAGPERQLLQLKNLSAEDLKERRQQEAIRVAVLPLLPEGEMTFAENPAVDRAAGMIVRLQTIEGIQVTRMLTLRRTWRTLEYNASGEGSLLPRVAGQLGVDFLIGGELQPGEDESRITLRVYDKDGKLLATADPATGRVQKLESESLLQLVRALSAAGMEGNAKAAALATILGREESVQSLNRRLAANETAFELLIEGYQKLENATLYNAGDPEGQKLNEAARSLLRQALEADPENPWTLSLLANCEFNLENREPALEMLTRAYNARQQARTDPSLKLEIEADYELFVNENPAAAIALYEQLVGAPESTLSPGGLRARWMLAGLYLGDWGATDEKLKDLFPEFKDPRELEAARRDRAREMVLGMLQHWPESSESAYYARFIQPLQKANPVPGSEEPREVKYATKGPLRLRQDLTYGLSAPGSGRSKVARQSHEGLELPDGG